MRRARLTAVLLAATCVWPANDRAATDGAPVEAELFVPPAEAYVIGDAVPLYWRFKNVSTEPLAFMWEGCCRLNGRLTVTCAGQPLTPIPPGQALAHMFAKAERLEPGKPRDFDTRLSDWVQVGETGVYELNGRYTGVLPDQRPQVPRGLNLWRDAAVTPAIRVALLNVQDYWAQRADRESRRGLRLELVGANRLPPLRSTPLRLRITNLRNTEQKLTWPDGVELWTVDAAGRRVTSGGTEMAGVFAESQIPPGGAIEREVAFSSDRLEGEAFGDYRVFVDLKSAGVDQPRVPSNELPVRWHLGAAEVVELLQEASQGHRTGARNAPLKLLRVYLAELGSVLQQLDASGLSAEAGTLMRQLRLAACLKPIGPKPGRVEVGLTVGAAGRLSFAEPATAACLGGTVGPATNQLASLLSVRRHLGWEVGLVLVPAPTAVVRDLREAGVQLAALQAELAAAPRVMPSIPTNIAAGALVLGPAGGATDLGLLLMRSQNRLTLRIAQPPPPQLAADALHSFAELSGPDALEAILAGSALASPRVYLLAAGDVSLAEVFRVAAPLLQRGLQVSFGELHL